MEGLHDAAPELGGVVNLGNHADLEGKLGRQLCAHQAVALAQMASDEFELISHEGTMILQWHATPFDLHLDHRANEVVELSAACRVALLCHLVTIGHFVDHEEGLGLLPCLHRIQMVALWGASVGASVSVIIDLELDKVHDSFWSHGKQLALCQLVTFDEGLTVNMLHERKDMHVVVFGLRFGLARGVVLNTGALNTGGGGASHGLVLMKEILCDCGRMMSWQRREYEGGF